MLTSAGCGAAGAAILANTLFIQPNTIFSVQWTAMMIFMVLVGGLGTFEGPIVGALILFLLQDQFGNGGVWYLVGLGTTAILFALFLPRGIWGTISDRFHIPICPDRLLGPRPHRRPGCDGGPPATDPAAAWPDRPATVDRLGGPGIPMNITAAVVDEKGGPFTLQESWRTRATGQVPGDDRTSYDFDAIEQAIHDAERHGHQARPRDVLEGRQE